MKTKNSAYDNSQHLNDMFKKIEKKSDKVIEIFLVSYFFFGLILAFFYSTFFIATTIGGAVLLVYFAAKKMFPTSNLKHYVASAGVAIFMGQYIYQMHGMFEMHFFAFIGSTLMITYRNWKVQIPLAILIVIHHGVFGWLQYSNYVDGTENLVYFTQLDYMNLQTFIIHCFLAIVIIFICGLWAYDLNKMTKNIRNSESIVMMEKISAQVEKNISIAVMMAEGMDVEIKPEEDDIMGQALLQIKSKLNTSS